MLLKDYIPNIDLKFRKLFFSDISFDSTTVKKNNIFLQLKVANLMEIILYQMRLKEVLKL